MSGSGRPHLAVSVSNRGWFRSRQTGVYLVGLTNTGDAPARRVSVDIDLARGLVPRHPGGGRWHCSMKLTERRETCRYKGVLQPRRHTVLVLPERVDASSGAYLVGLADAGLAADGHVSVSIGLAHGLVPVCVGGSRPDCAVHLRKHGKLCSCRDLRLDPPAGAGPLPGSYRPGSYLVSLAGIGDASAEHVFVAGDVASSLPLCAGGGGSHCSENGAPHGTICSCQGLLIPELRIALVLPGGYGPSGDSFPVVRPAEGAAAGVSADGRVVDVARIKPSA